MSRSAHAVDDLRLANRCVSGDEAAQRDLFRREQNHVHATLYRVLGSNAEMDDLMQEAFLEIFRSLPSFRGESLLSTWLDRVAVRVAYAYLARRRRRPQTTRLELVPEPHAGDASAEERAQMREAARRLYGLLDDLEPKKRIAFTLHVLDERPLKDVAFIMESSMVAAKVRVWRAMRHIKERAGQDPLLASFLGPPEQEDE